MQPLSHEYARKIAHYFKLYLGLNERQAKEFVSIQQTEGLIEHKLPFGKFWRNDGKWYVTSCYGHRNIPREVETMITMVSVKLESLKARFDAGKPAWNTPPLEPTSP